MNVEIIEQRLAIYQCKTRLDEINALKEISQEIALMSLSKAGFFKEVEFHGGTALRILYGINRFSEDLDFALLKPTKKFNLNHYLKNIQNDFDTYGIHVSSTDRKEISKTVQKQFLKIDSLGSELSLEYPGNRSEGKIKIKFEVDTNPPQGAKTELKYLTFPLSFSVLAKDQSSMFAGKLHALLCRAYEKGRDWYDFVWFISSKTDINYDLLTHAINQQGPWANQSIKIDRNWLIKQLSKKIKQLHWPNIIQDVKPLLRTQEQTALKVWGEAFFLSLTDKLVN
ncbi:MAG: nucleotidyl transferase AbiEii/AbiGii toxin family protein [Candidatus Berkiella sp.]